MLRLVTVCRPAGAFDFLLWASRRLYCHNNNKNNNNWWYLDAKMADGRVTTMSINFGFLLCLFLILNGIKQDKTLRKPLSNSSNLYFASQEACSRNSFFSLSGTTTSQTPSNRSFPKRFYHVQTSISCLSSLGSISTRWRC